MRRIRFGLWLSLAFLLLSPGVALAQNPDRLNGTFAFEDRVETDKNTLEFQVEGRAIGAAGSVRDLAGATQVVTIGYRMEFPNRAAASEQTASVTQGQQLLVTLTVLDGDTTIYEGQAAPNKCKMQARIRDAQSNDPDDPDEAQATVSCDLGNDWSEFENELEAPPPPAALIAVDDAFDNRKDVKADTQKGKLQIKHNGDPVVP